MSEPAKYRSATQRLPHGAYHIRVVDVFCPRCNEGLTDKRDGSFNLHSGSGYTAGEIVTCNGCDEPYRVPGIMGRLDS